ncbi:unnamed protein product [Rotaria sordida]|uniref:Ig-like domain-containing protein n=1 Tax=Rotaria sordida TaxID=392033 RepID=A0A814WSL9_9BILA|nr:unnamed protein product [Rotaria sordida]CAF3803484.1 unnamed protein product [Rotaria sordida]
MSQIKIPLLPLDCIHCQSAYQIDIQLIDEQFFGNRTIQRIKIFLKNFEIEDSSYICLINICPIIVEYGSDTILLNITSSLFSHVFLSFIYLNSYNYSIICSIQTRFAIFSLNQFLTCTEKIYLHPRLNIQILRQLLIYDCRAYLFEENIYQTSIKFYQKNFLTNNQQITKIKSSGKTCEYILENIIYINNISLIQTNVLFTTINLYSFYNPWKKDIQILGTCQTKLIPYREMFFTNDIIHIRNIIIEQGQTIQIHCPIDGSKEYLKYVWYYQRYQPKYQISNNRTILLSNITEQMQGQYICIGDDGNEKLEFEMTLHVIKHKKTNNNSFHIIIILILIICFILFCLIIILIIYFLLKKKSSQISSSMNYSIQKQNSLIIHHDVIVTIQHSTEQQLTNSLWNQAPYHTLDYIDEQPAYHIPSNQLIHIPSWTWNKQLNSDIKQQQQQQKISHQFSTRHRNLNGQPPTQLSVNIPLLKSNSDIKLPLLVKFHQISHSINNCINEQYNNIEILKISVPLLNQYPLIKSTNSMSSFDSQYELDEFNRMTYVCMENEAVFIDRQSQKNIKN